MLHPFITQLLLILIKIVCLLVAIAYYTIAERKIMAAIQRRRGPNVVGFWGLLQPLADGLKLVAKEMVIPSHSNSRIFVIAPLTILTLGLLSWSILPFACFDASEYANNNDVVETLFADVNLKKRYSNFDVGNLNIDSIPTLEGLDEKETAKYKMSKWRSTLGPGDTVKNIQARESWLEKNNNLDRELHRLYEVEMLQKHANYKKQTYTWKPNWLYYFEVVVATCATVGTLIKLINSWSGHFDLLVEANTVADVRYGLLLILALSSLTVYGLIIAGWASNSKYAFLGALRSAAQMISYEVAISLVILPVIFMSGSLNFTEIVHAQGITTYYVGPLLPLSIIFFISMIAETNRTPFDLPEAEAELVAGYNIEYSSIIFAMFFLAEYGNMIMMSLIKSELFIGGWNGISILPSATLLALKALVFCFAFVLVRATFPRYRYDQLMDIGWKIFLPVATGLLVFVIGLIMAYNAHPVVAELDFGAYNEPQMGGVWDVLFDIARKHQIPQMWSYPPVLEPVPLPGHYWGCYTKLLNKTEPWQSDDVILGKSHDKAD